MSATQISGGRAQQRTKVITTALLGLFLIYTLVPLLYVVISATKSDDGLFNSFGLWFAPHFEFFSNIRKLFTFEDGVYGRWLINTAFYSVTSAVGATLLASAAGYAFAKFRFAGRDMLFAITLGAVMIPQTALAIPLFLLMSRIGLVDSPWAVILPSLVNPFGVYLMRVYARAVGAGRSAGGGPHRRRRGRDASSPASCSASSPPPSSPCCCSPSSAHGTTISCRW